MLRLRSRSAQTLPRWLRETSSQYLGVFFGDGKASHWTRSYSDAETWEPPIAIGEGVIGDDCETAHGLKYFFELRAGAGATFDVWVKALDNQLATVRGWTATNLTAVDEAPIACGESTEGQSAWRIAVNYYLGGALTFKTSPDVITFA